MDHHRLIPGHGTRVRITALSLLLAVLLIGPVAAVRAQDGGPAPEAASQPQAVAAALSTGFTYQGRLVDAGSPANGAYDFEFLLYDAAGGGAQVGSTVTVADAAVSNGLFTVQLDVGATAFPGDARWLEVRVRPGASAGAYTALSPRQALAAAPYALSLRPGAVVSGANGDTSLKVEHTAASGTTYGLYSRNYSTSGYGVVGYASATGGATYGVYGENAAGAGAGVFGKASSTLGGTYGVYGLNLSTSGIGMYGYASASSGATIGVKGRSDSAGGTGVSGVASASSGASYGVYGQSGSTDGRGVSGYASAASGETSGVYGLSASTSGIGVTGSANAAAGITYGVYGASASTGGYGVVGYTSAASGSTMGVYGQSASTSGRGVFGYASTASGATHGVYGVSASTDGIGVSGYALKYGVYGESGGAGGIGVYGIATETSGAPTVGVLGESENPSGYGVYGAGAFLTSYGGYFEGKLHATGNFSAGGTKAFKIDHPLDPENKYLYHFAQESPEVQNVYNGVVILDASGQAAVALPTYFGALNTGAFRYQLTAIGAPMPDLHIAQEIQDNRFQIAGGKPGMKVSWEMTAVRNDPYLRDHAVQTEAAKPADEQGKYQYPQGYGQPEELGLDYQRRAQFDRAAETAPPSPLGGE